MTGAAPPAPGNDRSCRVRRGPPVAVLERRVFRAVVATFAAHHALALTVSDRWAPLAWNLYGPALVTGLAGVALAATLGRAPRERLGGAALLAALGVAAVHREQPLLVRGPPVPSAAAGAARGAGELAAPAAGGSLTLMAWNVRTLGEGGDVHGVRAAVAEVGPDVLAVVQGGPDAGRAHAALADLLPGGWVALPESRLYVAARHPLTLLDAFDDRAHARLAHVLVEPPAGPLHLLVVHLRQPGVRADEPAFAALREALARLPLPAIVAGDFNAPRDSARLAGALAGWTDPFLIAARRRYLATWPAGPLPLWQIDHAVVRGLVPLAATIHPSRASDHAPLVVRFATSAHGAPGRNDDGSRASDPVTADR